MKTVGEKIRARRDRAHTVESLVLRGLTTLDSDPTETICTRCDNAFTAHYVIQHICPRCVEDATRLSAEQYRLQRASEREATLARFGLVGELQRMTLDGFAPEGQYDGFLAIRQFVEDYPRLHALALIGDVGTGKSHLAAGAVIALADRQATARFVHMPTLLNRLRSAPDWQRAAQELVAPLFEVDVLVLDDFGREKETPTLPEMLDALIDRRWLERAPTIITANLTLGALKKRLGPAAESRFLSEALVAELRGEDWRRSGRGKVLPKAMGDPAVVCETCQGAGWVCDAARFVGTVERLLRCPSCSGKGY